MPRAVRWPRPGTLQGSVQISSRHSFTVRSAEPLMRGAIQPPKCSAYRFGLAFSKEPGNCRRTDTIGCPLQATNLGQREYRWIIEKARVRPIEFRGLRHTCATLLLRARVPVHYAQARLGHRDVARRSGSTLTESPLARRRCLRVSDGRCSPMYKRSSCENDKMDSTWTMPGAVHLCLPS